jgi:hypothetical protein
MVATMVKSRVVMRPGMSSGTLRRNSVRNSPAPSTRAASSISVGTAWAAKVHIRYSPKGEISDGMITAHGVLVSPILLNIRNVGTASAVGGTATAPMTIAKTAFLPTKSNLASPYPPSRARNVAPPAPTTTYSRVLSSQRVKMPSLYVKVSAMLLKNANLPSSNQSPKEENRPSWVLVELISSQTSGNSE